MLKDLMSKTFTGEIKEGKHSVTLHAYQYVENNSNPDWDYIKMTFIIDGTREYARNMFERDISIMLSQTRRQLGRNNDDIDPYAYLEELSDNKTPLDMWFSYPTVATKTGAKRVQNISWQEPTANTENEDKEEAIPLEIG